MLTTGLLYAAAGTTTTAESATTTTQKKKSKKANAGVCDPLRGSPNDLHDLCENFCEKQECKHEDPLSAVCAPPDPGLLAEYNARKRPEDPEMPCVRTPCPCWNADEIGAILGRISSDDFEFCVNEETSDSVFDLGFGDLVEDELLAVRVRGDLGANEYTCRYIDETTDPETVRVMLVTQEEFESCMVQIEDLDDELGACVGSIVATTP